MTQAIHASGQTRAEGKLMHQLTETVSKTTTFKKLMAIAALACTIFAGTLTADVVKAERSSRGLDPMIHAIIDAVEAGKPISSNDFAPKTTLKQRTKTTKKPVKIGSRSRLKIKFADELRVRISDDGQLVSRTNKSIGTVIDTIQALGVTLTPTANVEESKIDELIARAEARSGKQMPDIGGVFWVDGPASSVSVAANIFFAMPEVEWLLSHTLLPYETSNGKSQLI
ncbi:MAG: hypothetical protein QF444_06500, partial [Phycisphaerales bacterium]|nr:hypothetical protein [Phycisphaerales bacterium]